MAGNSSAITTTRTVDPPLAQNAGYRFDANDRQYIDNQIRGCEQQLVSCVLGGANCTYVQVDAGSVALAVGDVVTLAGSTTGVPTVTKGVSAALVLALSAFGVVLNAASPGAVALVAIDGVVAPSTTGLAAASGCVRVNTTTGRCERVASFTAGDYVLGTCDAQGYLNLDPGYAYPSGGGGGATLPFNQATVTKSANYTIVAATDNTIVCTTTPGITITFPAAPSNGDTFTVSNISGGSNTLSANGNTFQNGAGTFTLADQTAITARFLSAFSRWIFI